MSDPVHPDNAGIIVEKRGVAGFIILNRPAALNALTLEMIRAIDRALTQFEADATINRVIVTGAEPRAFCAGGDIRRIYESGQAGRYGEAVEFWREEYRLNTKIRHYSKPYISLMNGYVMGGGVGLSAHGQFRVASETYVFAMPEVTIGFFPDVGAGFVLPKLPCFSGRYLAMTGERVNAADAQDLGLATHLTSSSDMSSLADTLCAGEPIEQTLERYAMRSGRPELRMIPELPLLERCFSADDALQILARLDTAAEAGSLFAEKTAATIRAKSPTSVAVTLEQMKRCVSLTFDEVMAMDSILTEHFMRGHDFYEGVRALLINRDGKPQWQPARLEEVSKAIIDAHFSPFVLS